MSAELMADLPPLALSVRQPWAWAINEGHKPLENRSRHAMKFLGRTGRYALHASQGMKISEYEYAKRFMAALGVECPPPHELVRGGIIGSFEYFGVLKDVSKERWGIPPNHGMLLGNIRKLDQPIPCMGELGFFRWEKNRRQEFPPILKWMMPKAKIITPDAVMPEREPIPSLFD